MRVDYTQAVEQKDEDFQITILDGCDFFKPKTGSLLVVKLCAFCQYGQFKAQDRNGLCQYPKGSEEVK